MRIGGTQCFWQSYTRKRSIAQHIATAIALCHLIFAVVNFMT